MTKKIHLTSTQVACMMAASSLMFPYTFLPVLRVPPANQDAWLVVILSVLYSILFSTPILILSNKFRGLDVGEMTEIIVGKVGGRVANALMLCFVLFCFTACMLAMALYLKLYVLAETPLWVLVTFLLIPLTYASMKGAGTIGRLAMIIVPLISATIIFFFVLGLKDMKVENILPILADSSFLELNIGAILTGARVSEIIILGLFSFYLREKDSINGTFFKGLTIYGAINVIITMSTLLLMGSGVAKLMNNPFLTYARQVGGGDILQRVQALTLFTWFSGSIMKLMIYNYMGSFLLSKIVNNKKLKSRHFAVPISAAAFILSLLRPFGRMSTLHYLNSQFIFSSIVFSAVFILPLTLILIYLFRYKSVNKATTDLLNAKQQQQQQQQQPPQPSAQPQPNGK